MAAKLPSSDPLPLDPDDELTRPEARPALRAVDAVGAAEAAKLLGKPAPGPDPAASDADEGADEVTLVDPGRRRLVSAEALPPPDFPDLD